MDNIYTFIYKNCILIRICIEKNIDKIVLRLVHILQLISELTEYISSIPGQGLGFSITPSHTQNFSKELNCFSSLYEKNTRLVY